MHSIYSNQVQRDLPLLLFKVLVQLQLHVCSQLSQTFGFRGEPCTRSVLRQLQLLTRTITTVVSEGLPPSVVISKAISPLPVAEVNCISMSRVCSSSAIVLPTTKVSCCTPPPSCFSQAAVTCCVSCSFFVVVVVHGVVPRTHVLCLCVWCL